MKEFAKPSANPDEINVFSDDEEEGKAEVEGRDIQNTSVLRSVM